MLSIFAVFLLLRKDTQTHMNKNAYEIRLDVLGNAMGLVMDEYNRKFGIWERRDMENKTSDPAPKFPGTQEILDKAEELYRFVENSANGRCSDGCRCK